MLLRVAYIARDNGPKKTKRERKLSETEILHREGLGAIASYRIRAKERAEKKFADLDKEIEELEKQRDAMNRMC